MIVCTRCGFQNEDTDTFCGSCAGFLEWAGERVAEEAPPEPEPDPEPVLEAAHQGFVERVRDRIGIGEARTTDEAPADVTPAGGAVPSGEREAAAPATVAAAASGDGEAVAPAAAVLAAAPAAVAGAGAPSTVAAQVEAPVDEP
ncbi:MAG: hypothetical protein ACRDWW_06255 [Acidimicrobiales bacterium]